MQASRTVAASETVQRLTEASKVASAAIEALEGAVAEAAVIGVAHPKWDERPLLIVVKKPEREVGRQELLDFMRDKIAKWWLPDDVVFVDSLPHTATGKLLKTKLREDFRGHKLPGLPS